MSRTVDYIRRDPAGVIWIASSGPRPQQRTPGDPELIDVIGVTEWVNERDGARARHQRVSPGVWNSWPAAFGPPNPACDHRWQLEREVIRSAPTAAERCGDAYCQGWEEIDAEAAEPASNRPIGLHLDTIAALSELELHAQRLTHIQAEWDAAVVRLADPAELSAIDERLEHAQRNAGELIGRYEPAVWAAAVGLAKLAALGQH